MRKLLNIITPIHRSTKRDYIGRMMNEKVKSMKIAKKFERDYWDGDRQYGYGGYKYDGRWRVMAEKLVKHFKLKKNAKILDVGCGKGHLMYEFTQVLPGCEVVGFDISKHGLKDAKPEIKKKVFRHKAQDKYPYKDNEFDLVVCINTLHNLLLPDLDKALKEIQRVGKAGYIVVEGYRNEEELFNLECWALTAEQFLRPEEWVWFYDLAGYKGDYEFIYFE